MFSNSTSRRKVVCSNPDSDIEHIDLSDVSSSADDDYLSIADGQGDIKMRESDSTLTWVKREPETPTTRRTPLNLAGPQHSSATLAVTPFTTISSSSITVPTSAPTSLNASALGLSLGPVVISGPVALAGTVALSSGAAATSQPQPRLNHSATVKRLPQNRHSSRVLPPRASTADRKPAPTTSQGASTTPKTNAPTADADETTRKMEYLIAHVARLELELQEQGKALQRASFKHNPKTLCSFPADSDDLDSDFDGNGRRRSGKRDPQRVVLTRCVRQRVRVVLGVHSSLPKEDWTLAPAESVNLFNSGMATKDGPGQDMLAVDWDVQGRTPWTKQLASYLTHDFETERLQGTFPPTLGAPSKSSVLSAFLNHICYLKQAYKRETQTVDEEEEESLTAAQRERDRKSRSDSRKRQIFDRRGALLGHHGYPAEVQDSLQKIGVHAMSSEESDGEVGERLFWVKMHKWRNPDLTAWLQAIDGLPLVNTIGTALPRRQYYRTRRLSHKQSTNTYVPKGLPKSYYSQDWLAKDGARMRLRMCQQGDIPTI